jgi:prepilin-type N-terminal cleavage/methylation domain-containing protein
MGHSGRGRRGFTLMELLVTLFLVGILFPLVANVCVFVGRSIADLDDRARTAQETLIICDVLARDFGAALSARAGGSSRLECEVRDALPRKGTRIVHYSLDGDRLVRTDTRSGTRTVVATGLTAFNIRSINAETVRIELTVHEGTKARCIILMGHVS